MRMAARPCRAGMSTPLFLPVTSVAFDLCLSSRESSVRGEICAESPVAGDLFHHVAIAVLRRSESRIIPPLKSLQGCDLGLAIAVCPDLTALLDDRCNHS